MNFFQMPHFIWDMDLDVYERAVLTHIVRKTMGWGKIFDGISLSQFVKDLKISKPKVISTIKSLIEKGLIIKEMTKKDNGSQSFNQYQIHPKITQKANEKIVNEIDRGSKPHLHGVVNEIDRGSKPHLQTKETNTKETNTKEKDTKNTGQVTKTIKEYFELVSEINSNLVGKERMRLETTIKNMLTLDEIEPTRLINTVKRVIASNNNFLASKLFNSYYLRNNFLEMETQVRDIKEENEIGGFC